MGQTERKGGGLLGVYLFLAVFVLGISALIMNETTPEQEMQARAEKEQERIFESKSLAFSVCIHEGWKPTMQECHLYVEQNPELWN